MRKNSAAAAVALALMATPALAESPQKADPAAAQGQPAAQQQSIPAAEAANMLGKPVKLAGSGKQVGEITDVMLDDGSISDVVVQLREPMDAPIMVNVGLLSPDGDTYALAMSEEELTAAEPQQPDASD